ncbi:MAG: GNAT family N-acetyltransferase [Thermomicrobiales bacterium]
MSTTAGWTIAEAVWDDPDGEALRQAQREEIAEMHGGNRNSEPGTPPSAADVSFFVIARGETGQALACGALRQLDATSAEVKRMYVLPEVRGTGLSTAVLRALEDAARTRGWTTLRLETGRVMPAAIRFYQREGYLPIPPFGPYIGSDNSLCFAKVLASAS